MLGYSTRENADRVRGIAINGIAPTAATIQNFTYPGSRKLYIYVKGEHMTAIPGLREFLAAYSQGWNPGGYLEQRGLIRCRGGPPRGAGHRPESAADNGGGGSIVIQSQ